MNKKKILVSHCQKSTLEKSDWTTKNGQSRDIGNIACTRHRTKTNKAQKHNIHSNLKR